VCLVRGIEQTGFLINFLEAKRKAILFLRVRGGGRLSLVTLVTLVALGMSLIRKLLMLTGSLFSNSALRRALSLPL
jgi:hypothetical protein